MKGVFYLPSLDNLIFILNNLTNCKKKMKKVNGSEPFQILAHSFSVAPTTSGYTLAYSANGIDYTAYSTATPANETLLVCNAPKNVFWMLSGNTDNNVVISF